MPSLDVGLGMSWKEYEYPGYFISRRHCYDVLLHAQLVILNPNRTLLQNLRPFHRVSIGAYSKCDIGIGSIGRFHFKGVSAGAFLSTPVWSDFGWARRLQGQSVRHAIEILWTWDFSLPRSTCAHIQLRLDSQNRLERQGKMTSVHYCPCGPLLQAHSCPCGFGLDAPRMPLSTSICFPLMNLAGSRNAATTRT